MNKYYVSVDRGSDSNDGLSPATPWKTIGKAIGPSPGVSLGTDGATVYIEPGAYYESVTLALNPSDVAPLAIVGDCDGAGFLAGGRTTPTVGVVEWSAWVDDATPRTDPCLSGGSGSHVALRRLKMYGGIANPGCVQVTTGKSWSIVDSAFICSHSVPSALVTFGASASGGATAGLGLLVERCSFLADAAVAGVLVVAAEAAAEYSLDSVIRDCRFVGGYGFRMTHVSTGLGALGTGVTVEHCTSFAGYRGAMIYEGVATPTLTTPVSIRGCFFRAAITMTAGNATHVTEDWNVLVGGNPANVPAGPNSIRARRAVFDFDDGLLVGTPLRPMGTPTAGSLLGGFVGSGAFPPTDLTGRARPEGSGAARPAAGALERHDTGEANAQYADAGSSACLALTGPSSLERPILVDATATTIGVKVRWDGNHGDANKPRAVLLANPEIGIASDQSVEPATSGGSGSTPNAYEALTFAPVTPTKAGALMLRLESRSAAGNGVAYFDSITLS